MNKQFFIFLLSVVSTQLKAFELIHSDYGQDFYFVFNGGSKDGVGVGMKACVYNNEDEELFCGKVAKVNESKSGVYAGADQEAWLESGFFVKVKELNNSPRNHRTKALDLIAGNSFNNLPVNRPTRWYSSYLMTPIMPFQFSHSTYNIDSRISGEGSIWSSSERVKQSLVGFQGSRRSPISQGLDQEFSFLWRYVRPLETDSDYDPNSGQVYVIEKSSATDFAIDWSLISNISQGNVNTYLFVGPGVEFMTYSFQSNIVDEEGSLSGELANSKAQLSGLVAKFGFIFEKPFGGASGSASKGVFSSKIAALVPITSRTQWTHGSHNLSTDTIQKDNSTTQLEESALFKKNSIGFEMELAAGWNF
jgi:hypothetical protein